MTGVCSWRMGWLLAALGLLVAAAPAFARGEGGKQASARSVAKARRHFDAGFEAYHQDDFEAAIQEFEAAAALVPSPLLDYNIGSSYDQLGRAEQAVEYYKKYLEELPGAANAAEVEKRIAALTPRPPPLKVVEPPPPPPEPPRPVEPPKPVECTQGKVAVSGHCCWPAQGWSEDRGQCFGRPVCPDRLVAHAEACVQPPPLLPSSGSWRVPVYFRAKEQEVSYQIKVAGQRCSTPCTVPLAPGTHAVKVDGPVSFEANISVPRTATTIRVEHVSRASYVAGAVLLVAGFVAVLAAVGVATSSNVVYGGLLGVVAAGMLTTGAVFAGAGGSNRLLPLREEFGALAAPPKVRFAAGLAPVPGGGATLGLAVSF